MQVIKNFPGKCTWVIPWIDNWHFLLHVLDVIFQGWEGFGIMELGEVSGVYRVVWSATNTTKDILHLSVWDAQCIWLAFMEREGISRDVQSEDGVEALLSTLRTHRHGSHETFG